MANISIEWEGLDTLMTTLTAYQEKVPANIEKSMKDIGDHAKEVMDEHTPVGTKETKEHKPGTLKKGNTLTPEANGFTLSNAVEYAKFVEEGTRYMEAQPFLAPAKEYATQAMEEQLPEEAFNI